MWALMPCLVSLFHELAGAVRIAEHAQLQDEALADLVGRWQRRCFGWNCRRRDREMLRPERASPAGGAAAAAVAGFAACC